MANLILKHPFQQLVAPSEKPVIGWQTHALAIIREIFAHTKAIKHYPLGWLEQREQVLRHHKYIKNPRPILLVHGVIHNHSAFFALRREMTDWEWKNVFSLNYSTRHGSITGMIEDLSVKVDEILQQTGAKKVDIVAHSLGGLVARHYMSVGPGRGKVKNLITLGTCHYGTQASSFLKAFMSGSLAKDLKFNSHFMQTLNSLKPPRGSRITSIYAKNDWTAWPLDSCLLNESSVHFKNFEIDSTGHVGLLYHSLVFDIVYRTLSQSAFKKNRK